MDQVSWIRTLKKTTLLKITKICKLKASTKMNKKQIADLLTIHYSAKKIQTLKKNGNCPFTLEPAQPPFYKRTTFANNKTPHTQIYNLEPLVKFLNFSHDKKPSCPVTRTPFTDKEIAEISALAKIHNLTQKELLRNDSHIHIEHYTQILDSLVGEITNMIIHYTNFDIPLRMAVSTIDESYITNIVDNFKSLRLVSREAASDFADRTEITILQEPPNDLRNYFLYFFRTLENINW